TKSTSIAGLLVALHASSPGSLGRADRLVRRPEHSSKVSQAYAFRLTLDLLVAVAICRKSLCVTLLSDPQKTNLLSLTLRDAYQANGDSPTSATKVSNHASTLRSMNHHTGRKQTFMKTRIVSEQEAFDMCAREESHFL